MSASPGRGPARAARGEAGLARKLVMFSVLGAMVFAGLSLYGDVRALLRNLRAFHWGMFAVALALASGNYGLRFLRWQYYLRCIESPVPRVRSALIFLSGFVMSVTPGKIGEVFKSLLLREAFGYPVARTAPVVVAERLTDMVALVLLTALGALSFEHGVGITAAGAVGVGSVLAACAFRPFGELLLGLVERLPVASKLAPRMREAYESLHTLTRAVPLLVGTTLATAAWSLEVLALGAVLAGFSGLHLSWEATTFAYSASTVAGAAAMMPGGLGVTEAGMTGLLLVLGDDAMSPSVATATTMLVRLATLWWAVLLGLVALALYRRTAARRDRERGGAPGSP